jgi:hypothetical protein
VTPVDEFFANNVFVLVSMILSPKKTDDCTLVVNEALCLKIEKLLLKVYKYNI